MHFIDLLVSRLANLAGNRSALEAALQNHITAVAGRYHGKVYAWDVVNEAVSDHPNGSDYLKHNIWYPTGKLEILLIRVFFCVNS